MHCMLIDILLTFPDKYFTSSIFGFSMTTLEKVHCILNGVIQLMYSISASVKRETIENTGIFYGCPINS